MSKYAVTVTYEIESDDVELDDVIAHFDNQANEQIGIEVDLLEPEGDDNEVGTMKILDANAIGEITEY